VVPVGIDQAPHLEFAREIVRSFNYRYNTKVLIEPQVKHTEIKKVIGIDGKDKMSKSLNNYVAVNDSPNDIFGKLMSISDELMARYYPLLLGRAQPPQLHPMEAKKQLASEMVAAFHTAVDGARALEEWERRFSAKRLDQADLPAFGPPAAEQNIISLVVAAYAAAFALTKSRGEVRRLIEQGSVQLRGEKIRDPQAEVALQSGDVLRLDKTRAVRVR